MSIKQTHPRCYVDISNRQLLPRGTSSLDGPEIFNVYDSRQYLTAE